MIVFGNSLAMALRCSSCFILLFFCNSCPKVHLLGDIQWTFPVGDGLLHCMIQDMLFLFHNKMDLWHSELNFFHLQVLWLEIGVQCYFTDGSLYKCESHRCIIPKNAMIILVFSSLCLTRSFYHWQTCSFYRDVTPNWS